MISGTGKESNKGCGGKWWWLLVILAFAYLGLLTAAYLHADHLIFAPHRAGYLPSAELLTLSNADQQRFCAYYLPPVKENGAVVLFSHGYNSDLSDLLERAHALNAEGYGVMLYDYQGYGLSQGRPSESACYKDALAAYDFLVQELQLDSRQIIVYGHSLGAAVALELALQRPVHYLLLDSPFVSAFRVVTRWPIIPWDKFDNLSKIARLPGSCYLEIRYSCQDKIIGCWHSKELYAASLRNADDTQRKLVQRVGAHDDYEFTQLPDIAEI